MNSTRIYQVLITNSAHEHNRFLKFLHSPYFNVHQGVIELGELIINHIRKDLIFPEKENIWFKIYPKEEFNSTKFRKLCSDLLIRYEDFLMIENLHGNKLLQNTLVIDQIQKRKILPLTQKSIANGKKLFERTIEKSSAYYYNLFEFEKSIYNLKSEYEKKAIKKVENRNINIDAISRCLDQFYIIEKLRLACDLATWQRIYKIEEKPLEVEIILKLLNRNELLNNPAISLYRNMYLMLTEKDSNSNYQQLKTLYKKQIDILSSQEKREILDSMISYCVGRADKGDEYYLGQMLEMYDIGIASEIILLNDELSPTTFRNYVLVCLRLELFDKAEEFIHSQAKLLNENHRENAVNFSLARIYFYKKEFDKVVESLFSVDFENIFYRVNATLLLLATYYSMEEFITLESQIDSFLSFLRREKSLIESRKAPSLNFTKFLKRLISLPPNETKKLRKLKSDIAANTNVVNAKWLIEQIDALL